MVVFGSALEWCRPKRSTFETLAALLVTRPKVVQVDAIKALAGHERPKLGKCFPLASASRNVHEAVGATLT